MSVRGAVRGTDAHALAFWYVERRYFAKSALLPEFADAANTRSSFLWRMMAISFSEPCTEMMSTVL